MKANWQTRNRQQTNRQPAQSVHPSIHPFTTITPLSLAAPSAIDWLSASFYRHRDAVCIPSCTHPTSLTNPHTDNCPTLSPSSIASLANHPIGGRLAGDMTDEPESDETQTVELQQTTNATDDTVKREEESKQLDEPQSVPGELVTQRESGQSMATAATTADEEVSTEEVAVVETEERAEQQTTSASPAVDDISSVATNSVQASPTITDPLLEHDSAVESTSSLTTPQREQSDHASVDDTMAANHTEPSADPNSQQPSDPSVVAASTDNSDSDSDASTPSIAQPSPSASSTCLAVTSPSVSVSLVQSLSIPRESVLQVRLLLSSADEPVLVTVHIARDYLSQPKPFLGGYRHAISGRVRHHASVQTDRRPTGGGGGRERVSRDTQTVETATRSAQSGRSVGTQMARKDYYIGEEGETGQGERVIVAREYVSSDVLEAEREERAMRIQCWLRVCFAVRRMKQLKAAKEATEGSSERAKQVKADRKKREEEQQIHRRMHPKSKEDFTLLYAELNAWRQHEAARIHTLDVSDDERETQLSMLLSKEVKLLQTIDRLKIRASKERKEEAIHRRLEMMQSPKEWTTSAGHHVEVVTPYTVRAQELTSLYQALLLPVDMHGEEKEAEATQSSACLTWDGRVDVLLHCKYVVGEMASQLSADILQLIEREQEWVRRRHATPGWQAEQALAGMRKRLAALFLQFVQTPAYNPVAAVYLDSVGREGKQRMQELLNKPLAEREVRKRRPTEDGQDRMMTARVQA